MRVAMAIDLEGYRVVVQEKDLVENLYPFTLQHPSTGSYTAFAPTKLERE